MDKGMNADIRATAGAGNPMQDVRQEMLSKVPEVTLLFWIMKIVATTLGETGGDAVTMTWLGETTPHPVPYGYLIGTLIFAVVFIVLVVWQIKAQRFHPLIYWGTIVATTTLGTTMADLSTRDLGIGYAGGSALLFALLMVSLFVWHRTLGTVSFRNVTTPSAEMFYWVTIMFSQTLGTALGDAVAAARDEAPAGLGLGYSGAGAVFIALLLVVAVLYLFSKISHVALFWAAFILTRPLGAALGDLLDKPVSHGGLAMSRYTASAVLVGFMLACIFLFKHRAAQRAH